MADDMIKVNNVYIPNPSNYNAYPNLREQSSENSLGDMVRKIISCRWKIELKWDKLTKAQMSQLTDIKFLKSFSCNFPNTKGQFVTKTMYAGDISSTAKKVVDGVVESV